MRKTQATEVDHGRLLRLLQPALVDVDVGLEGPVLPVSELLSLNEGDVIAFDYPVSRVIDATVNGRLKYRGEVMSSGRKRVFQIQQLTPAA